MYLTLHHLAGTDRPIPAGFVHLPALPEQAAAGEQASPSMPLSLMEEAILRVAALCVTPGP